MILNTVIFDMDGLLIDSEPCWQEAGMETLQEFGVALTPEQYHSTTGLRTREWIDWWFGYFRLDRQLAPAAEEKIIHKAIEKIGQKAKPMKGVDYIFSFFKERDFKIGLATSSPVALIKVVTEKLGIRDKLDACSSAEKLVHSKPHPQVYLECAARLGVSPLQCVCFEDSFNGLIAVKAARMRCVAIPSAAQQSESRWDAADIKLPSLEAFNEEVLERLG